MIEKLEAPMQQASLEDIRASGLRARFQPRGPVWIASCMFDTPGLNYFLDGEDVF